MRIISQLKPAFAETIDERSVQETIEDMNKLFVNDGFIVSCLEDKTVYVKFNGEFIPLGTSSSKAFDYTFPVVLAADNEDENKYLKRT